MRRVFRLAKITEKLLNDGLLHRTEILVADLRNQIVRGGGEGLSEPVNEKVNVLYRQALARA